MGCELNNVDKLISNFADDDHLSWIADTFHNMIFETLASDYQKVIDLLSLSLKDNKISISEYEKSFLSLNKAYIYALNYFGV